MDALTTDFFDGTRLSASFSHTVSGSNRLLLVFAGTLTSGGSPIDVTDVSYGGQSLTFVTEVSQGPILVTGYIHLEVWRLVNPPSGPNTVSVDYAIGSIDSFAVAISYTGVDQTNPIGATANNSAGSGTILTVDLATQVANSLIVGGGMFVGGNGDPFTPGSGTTERWDTATGTDGLNDISSPGGEESAPTTGTYTFDFTASDNHDWAITAVEVREASATTADYAFKDGTSAAILAGPPALIDSFGTTLPDATNLVLVFVQISNTGQDRIITAGSLEVRRGTQPTDPLLAENEFQMDFNRGSSAPVGTFAFLLGRDTSPGANPTYGLFANASATGMNAEAKFLILNGVAYSDFVDGGPVALGVGEITVASLATTLPDQPTVVVGAVQVDQTGGSRMDLAPGDLRLKRGATVIASNQFLFEGDPSADDGDGAYLLLVARDATPGSSPTYSVTADPGNDSVANAEAKLLAFSGLNSAFVDTATVAVGSSRTVVGSTATTFPAGEDVLIGAFQMANLNSSDQTWSADTIDIARATNLDRASNEFGMRVPHSASPYDNLYVGLLNAVTTSSANPAYEGGAQATAASLFDMELKLVAVHVKDAGAPSCDALTVVTSDPAGQLWFNQTVEPDGLPYTTQVNVSASAQTGATPALSVTNDGGIACDVTIRLMSDPGTGRSLKFNTTNSAPWPADASREVPLDPSSVTVCSGVASGGTCDIWLWADYENALGGLAVVDVRVETL